MPKSVKIRKAEKPLAGTFAFPGDKSLSHRAIMFGSLAEGTSEFSNVLEGEDCVCTREAFEEMGVRIERLGPGRLLVHGAGLRGLKAPKKELWLGNSGTSMRILMGILAGQPFESVLTGDPSLCSRPMKRVTTYLRQMGADIRGRDDANFAPLTVKGGRLKGIDASLAVSSAQVKSAILMAGLYADGRTSVSEPEKSRDHTERFLKHFGAKIGIRGNTVMVEGGQRLSARRFEIAGDISSAAFFMAAAVLVPGSGLSFRSVLNNPTRTGIFDVLKRMGVDFSKSGEPAGDTGPEPVIDFSLKPYPFKAFDIAHAELPALIDEVPILCVLATQADGTSVVRDADELRVKESDRIEAIIRALSPMGAKISAEGNTLRIQGPSKLRGARVDSRKDHRIAMSAIIAGLIAEGETVVDDVECINTSFPDFFELLQRAGAKYELIDTP
ncbi:MAG TPA: 3-phosphoshikimate 1-carboxyvinyltransferase [Candidatus Eisenbacteria bacterium]|nr:3-phosphoshikimate 1-carboxyvinyltransferase [Candidatus Eisenbacteria bacterium]